MRAIPVLEARIGPRVGVGKPADLLKRRELIVAVSA